MNANNWWVGLTDKSQEGDFVWESGHPLTIQQWYSGEPNDHGSGEDCVHLNAYGKLNDYPCDGRYPEVVCQKGRGGEHPTTEVHTLVQYLQITPFLPFLRLR